MCPLYFSITADLGTKGEVLVLKGMSPTTWRWLLPLPKAFPAKNEEV